MALVCSMTMRHRNVEFTIEIDENAFQLYISTLKKRLSYNNPNLINVTHRCGEIVSTKRIGD